MENITHNKKKYKLIDMNSQFTLRQQKEARKFLVELINQLKSNNAVADYPSLLKKFNKAKLTEKEQAEKSKIEANFNMEILKNIADLDYEVQVLSLLYLEENEKVFNLDKYKQRLIDFESLEWNDSYGDVIKDFFSLKLPSLMKNFLTSFQAISQVNKIA